MSAAVRLFLASRSETRRAMLAAAGLEFECVDSDFDEANAKAGLVATGFEPVDLAEMLAEMKARYARAPAEGLIIGADQVLETDDGEMLSKPRSRGEARAQLEALSGRAHFLHSAAVVAEQGERIWGITETVALRMRDLDDAFLEDYLDREYETVRFNVGAYAIEGRGVQLFEEIEGSHFAILGLPLLPLLAFLREHKAIPA